MNSETNYQLACKKLGYEPKQFPTGASDGDIYDYHAHVLRVCIAAENAIKQPDGSFKEWRFKKASTEMSYAPCLKKDGSGSGWVYYGYGYDDSDTCTVVGRRLEYRAYDLMRASVKKLKQEYENYFNS